MSLGFERGGGEDLNAGGERYGCVGARNVLERRRRGPHRRCNRHNGAGQLPGHSRGSGEALVALRALIACAGRALVALRADQIGDLRSDDYVAVSVSRTHQNAVRIGLRSDKLPGISGGQPVSGRCHGTGNGGRDIQRGKTHKQNVTERVA